MFVAPTLASAAPHTQPSVTDVQKKLAELALKNTQLVEQFNQARVTETKTQKAASAAATKATSVTQSYELARSQFVQIVQDQYEGSSLGAAGALLESDSNSDYLTRIDSLGMMSTHVSQVVSRINQARTAAETASTTAHTLYAKAKANRAALAKQRTSITSQIGKYQTLLSKLNSAQQAAYVRSQTHSVTVSAANITVKAGTAAARRAVQFAIDQIGKPYVWGAAGPGTYDCSGLTMRAWQAGGVSLPHSAADQYNYGTHVSASDLEPGDLIFFYHPIGHVTIYAGNGMMVSAPTEGQDVTLVPLSAYMSDYVGATRLT
jgi:cell wall-associated NlpC family hydrolase